MNFFRKSITGSKLPPQPGTGSTGSGASTPASTTSASSGAAKPGSSIANKPSGNSKPLRDDDIPPPPPMDDDIPPPPPLPSDNAKGAPAPLPKKSVTSGLLSKTPSTSASSNNNGKPPTSSTASTAGAKPAAGATTTAAGRGSVTSKPVPAAEKADPDHVDFTIVPCLLRSKVVYVEANKYGDILKASSKQEVDAIMSSPASLIADLKKCGISLPANFDKLIAEDMVWVNANRSGRKSLVYYKSDNDAPAAPARAATIGATGRPSTRERQSFGAGPQMIATAEEADPNRYKVASKKRQSEAASKELKDLVGALNEIKAGSGSSTTTTASKPPTAAGAKKQ